MIIIFILLFLLIKYTLGLNCYNLCDNDITIQICSDRFFKIDDSICEKLEQDIINNSLNSSDLTYSPSSNVIIDTPSSSSNIYRYTI